MAEARQSRVRYDCVVCHNLSDLRDAAAIEAPKLLVLHSTLHGRIVEEGSALPARTLCQILAKYIRLRRAHVVAISALKAQSWGLDCPLVPPGIDPGDYSMSTLEMPRGLRVVDHAASRSRILRWDFHQRAFDGVPVTIVGRNPEFPAATVSRDWEHLRSLLSSHRFAIHTAHPDLEDGYNLATLEAMASGLPILGNAHPTSPVVPGESGFLSGESGEVRDYARLLLMDPRLAAKWGRAAREGVAARFPVATFVESMRAAVAEARRVWDSGEAAIPA